MVKDVCRRGFTLIEVLVSLVLFSAILFILFRGVTGVITSVTLGERQSRLHRSLKGIKRVMEKDIESMIIHPDWPAFMEAGSSAAPQRVIAFLRYGNEAEGNTETEWVEYWREPHPTTARLEQLIRYSGPADNRNLHKGEWWTTVLKTNLSGEILADNLIEFTLKAQTREESVTGLVRKQIQAVDVGISLTVEPVPFLNPEDPEVEGRLRKMWKEDGGWLHFRTKPGFSRGPDMEVLP